VKSQHEKGGFGSTGWKYDWSEKESFKNILRTHTTAVSARMLYKLAQDYKKQQEEDPNAEFKPVSRSREFNQMFVTRSRNRK
jgi:phenylalanyl-tRNA synthetase alpha subunit